MSIFSGGNSLDSASQKAGGVEAKRPVLSMLVVRIRKTEAKMM